MAHQTQHHEKQAIVQEEFLQNAIDASASIRLAGQKDPFEDGVSCCTLAPGDGLDFYHQLRRRKIALYTIVIIVIGVTGAVGLLAKLGLIEKSLELVIVLVPFSVSAIVTLGIYEVRFRKTIRNYLTQRNESIYSDDNHQKSLVYIQNPATFNPRKMFPQDVGYMLVYPEVNCVVIEGLCNRYQVYGSDVITFSDCGEYLLLEYRVGTQPFMLAISPNCTPKEYSKQMNLGQSNSWYESILRTFEVMEKTRDTKLKLGIRLNSRNS